MKAAHELSYVIPNDFSLAGFGGYNATTIVSPAITTVRYPYRELGKKAVTTVLQLLNAEDGPMKQIMKNELIVRESTQKITLS